MSKLARSLDTSAHPSPARTPHTALKALGAIAGIATIPGVLSLFACMPEETVVNLTTEAMAPLSAGEAAHFTFHANAAAVAQTDRGIVLSINAESASHTIRLVLDDASLDTGFLLNPGPGYVDLAVVEITQLCPHAGENCELGFTIEAEQETEIRLSASLARDIDRGAFGPDAMISFSTD